MKKGGEGSAPVAIGPIPLEISMDPSTPFGCPPLDALGVGSLSDLQASSTTRLASVCVRVATVCGIDVWPACQDKALPRQRDLVKTSRLYTRA